MEGIDHSGSEQAGVFTTFGLARYLECKPATLTRMRRENRGPRYTKVGRLVRYPRPWVLDWLESQAIPEKGEEARW